MKVFILRYERDEKEEEIDAYLNKEIAIKQMESRYLEKTKFYSPFIVHNNIDNSSIYPCAKITYSDYSHDFWEIIEKEVIE